MCKGTLLLHLLLKIKKTEKGQKRTRLFFLQNLRGMKQKGEPCIWFLLNQGGIKKIKENQKVTWTAC